MYSTQEDAWLDCHYLFSSG